ncbi:organic solvent ABC transporter permease [Marinobacter sp. BGYM27]|uniref:organic solvent ABC transporter permease n=1 Tax=unclassified Marinobacter TaxID=83889 RepID=UPI0021A6E385|nr:organic solvent ABC transporter permease [Marinobacter sp. BGYM27]MDG5500468.1 organic solvent ABC transporter permease [Marinobacter sp. BGYM27]
MRLKTALLVASTLILHGCFGGDSDDGDDTSIGQITLTGIGGLTYQTQSQRSLTDASGRYAYYPGETVDLSIGDLPVGIDIPTDDVITPLQFLPETRNQLQSSITDEYGLLSHKPVEKQVIQNPTLINITRFMMVMDDNETTNDGGNIYFTARNISQLNQAMAYLPDSIDFTLPVSVFALDDEDTGAMSVANQALAEICFYPPDDELCEDPPTQAEIDAAPAPPEADMPRDENIEYKDDLENKRDRILAAIRKVGDVQLPDVEEYLLRELDKITTERTNRYYLSTVTANISASDTAIREVFVRLVGGEPSLQGLESVSTDEMAVVIHSTSAQTHSAEYFVAGAPEDESEVIVNFRPADDYRWLRKPLRVIIE